MWWPAVTKAEWEMDVRCWAFNKLWISKFYTLCTVYFEVFLTLTEGFPRFFLSCKANARVKLAKTGHGQQSSTLVCIYVVWLLFVLFYVLFVWKCVLPPGDNPIAVNKYIISFYKAASCWYFYWVIYDARIHEYQILIDLFHVPAALIWSKETAIPSKLGLNEVKGVLLLKRGRHIVNGSLTF
jgi:hypothetical protein